MFDCDNTNVKKEQPIVFRNASKLLDFVIAQRKLKGNITIKIMADGGQGFFKISMRILPENYVPEFNIETENLSDFETHTHTFSVLQQPFSC